MSRATLFDPWFHRSSLFLLPILWQDSGTLDFIQTHIALEGIYSIHDHRLLLSGASKTGSLYFCFAADGWVASPYFEKELLLDNKKTAYVFNLSAHKADWNCFIQGRYPEFSPFLKERIKSFFGSGKEWDYVETFLYPEKLAGYQSPWHYYEGSHGSGFHRSWVGNPSDPYDLSKLEMLRM